MTTEQYIKGKIVDYAVSEAYHHGGINNMLAVAQVLRNRVSAGWFGGDWLQVIADAPKKVGTVYPPAPAISPRDTTFRLLLQKVEDIYHDAAEDLAAGEVDGQRTPALFYAELHDITSPWFEENILRQLQSHAILSKVGQVTFFA